MLQQGLGTLDSKIDQKAGALRSNPQAMGQLQQQQKTQLGKGITPDLMDALAAQKVLSEKTLANNQLKLSQEQNPATVAEQYEQQLVAMNKDELTAQTAGIMGERNKKRQQQTSAAKPPQPQGQRPPMPQGAPPQGIAGAPRPPTQFAAQGGIIGYDAGGLITDKLLTELGITRAEYDALPEAVKKGYIADAQKKADKTANQAGMQEKLAQPGKNIGQMVEGIASVGAEAREKRKTDYEAYKKNEALKTLGTTPAVVKSPVVDPVVPPVVDPPVVNSPEGQKEADLQDLIDKMQADQSTSNAGAVTPPKPLQGTMDKAGITPDQLTSESLRGANFPANASKTQVTDAAGDKTVGIMQTMRDSSPQEARVTEENRQDKRTDRIAKRNRANSYLTDKKKLDAEMLDPKRLEKERTKAGIRGLIEGGTGRGASIARGKFDANTVASRQASIQQQAEMSKAADAADDSRLAQIDVQAGETFKQVSKERYEAISGLAAMAGQDVTASTEQAKIDFEANKFGIKTKVDLLAVQSKDKLNQLIQENANVTQYVALMDQLQAGKIAALESYFKSVLPEIKAAQLAQKEGNTLTSSQQELLDDFTVKYNSILDAGGINDLIDDIKAQAVKGVSGGSGGSGGSSGSGSSALNAAMSQYAPT